eukprot:5188751-Prymnesium_polylepis.1
MTLRTLGTRRTTFGKRAGMLDAGILMDGRVRTNRSPTLRVGSSVKPMAMSDPSDRTSSVEAL